MVCQQHFDFSLGTPLHIGMISIVKIRSDRVLLLKALREVVYMQQEVEDISRKDARRLKVYCKEINKWIDELEEKKKEPYDVT